MFVTGPMQHMEILCAMLDKHVENRKGKITGVLAPLYLTMNNIIHFQNVGLGCLMFKIAK